MIRGREQLIEAYRDLDAARGYVDKRFGHPLGALLHARQVAVLRRTFRSVRPRRVLEIAPGPARLTAEVVRELPAGATILDASAGMMGLARKRLTAVGPRTSWRFVLGDAFCLPFRQAFDLIYSFRFLRHFENEDRRRLYAEFARVLRPGGALLFDAVNEAVSAPFRAQAPAGTHTHYDALLRPEQLARELRSSGFALTSLRGVQRRYTTLRRLQILIAPRCRPLARAAMELVDRLGRGEPLEWVVMCRRE